MERQGIHELSAAYAVDALDGEDRRRFEDHLAECGGCQDDVASFQAAAAALAYDVDAPAPPDALRERILARARSERPRNVLPFRPRRWALPVATGVAVVAACAALAFGLWAASLNNELGDRPQAIELAGADGSLLIEPSGEAVLIVDGLGRAPAGKTFAIWVIGEKVGSDRPVPAGLFPGAPGRSVVPLNRSVPEGAFVAVTLERAGGVSQPTSEPLFTAERA
jgi:anti-sigma-K factor RskA